MNKKNQEDPRKRQKWTMQKVNVQCCNHGSKINPIYALTVKHEKLNCDKFTSETKSL